MTYTVMIELAGESVKVGQISEAGFANEIINNVKRRPACTAGLRFISLQLFKPSYLSVRHICKIPLPRVL